MPLLQLIRHLHILSASRLSETRSYGPSQVGCSRRHCVRELGMRIVAISLLSTSDLFSIKGIALRCLLRGSIKHSVHIRQYCVCFHSVCTPFSVNRSVVWTANAYSTSFFSNPFASMKPFPPEDEALWAREVPSSSFMGSSMRLTMIAFAVYSFPYSANSPMLRNGTTNSIVLRPATAISRLRAEVLYLEYVYCMRPSFDLLLSSVLPMRSLCRRCCVLCCVMRGVFHALRSVVVFSFVSSFLFPPRIPSLSLSLSEYAITRQPLDYDVPCAFNQTSSLPFTTWLPTSPVWVELRSADFPLLRTRSAFFRVATEPTFQWDFTSK